MEKRSSHDSLQLEGHHLRIQTLQMQRGSSLCCCRIPKNQIMSSSEERHNGDGDTRAKRTRSRSNSGGAGGVSANIGSLLLLLGGIFAVVSAFLARQGFTGRDHGMHSRLSFELVLVCS